jgi:ATP-binding cassette subfamily B protein
MTSAQITTDLAAAEQDIAVVLARCELNPADRILEMADGYETLVGEGSATLSGGQKQRISIARAILKDGPIVLLDEATASIDPENESLIQQAFDALVQQGTHADLIGQAGLYRRFWEEHQQARHWKLGTAMTDALPVSGK